MGGHGGSSGYTKYSKAAKEVSDLKDDLHNGKITLGQYAKAKHAIMDKNGFNSDDAKLVLGMTNMTSESEKKQAYKDAKNKTTKTEQPSQVTASKNLAGQNGNPWPPNASGNHLEYEGGGGKGIWKQFGGGKKNGGVTSQEAKDMYSAVRDFTGSYSSAIRSAQQKGDTSSYYGKQGAQVENFIAAGIKSGNGWNGGATYRGIGGISDAALKNIQALKPGDSVDCNLSAAASWSTNRHTSEGFGSSYNHVTFVHTGSSQKGVSVKKISSVGYENEVLVSKSAKYKVVAVVPGPVGKYNSQTYVYVEDAD